MREASDMDLLREYARSNSEPAFAELVNRHISLVYSVALRYVCNSQDAEDVAQAVFIILARKAGQLPQKAVLTGWLYETTRFTAMKSLRSAARRRFHEQEAHMKSPPDDSGEHDAWRNIAPMLEDAMTRLGEKDRTLLALRFFENRNATDTAALLGIQEWAARKRTNRALEKLRRFFSKRGVTATTTIIAGAISANSVQAAPAVLAKSVTAAAVGKGAVAGGSALVLAKSTFAAAKTKTLVAAAATAVLAITTGVFLITLLRNHSSTGFDIKPVALANDSFIAVNGYIEGIAAGWQTAPTDRLMRIVYKDDRYSNGVDPDTRRTPDSPPAGHIKSVVAPGDSGASDYLASVNTSGAVPLQSARYTRHDLDRRSPLLGKRIRVSGWVKTKDVANWAGASLAIINSAGHVFACDGMTDRPISGTADWSRVTIVTDVPHEPCSIYFGPMLYGTGEIWCDDFRIDVVPSTTPITDDRIWHVWSSNPNDYSVSTDYTTIHDGHPALCIEYKPKDPAPRGSWMWWGQDIRNPDKYLGHTVRMTVWIKTENVTKVGQNLRPKGPNFKVLANGTTSPIKGTTEWTQHVITCFIPTGTQCLDTGFAFDGSGKVWIDMDSLKYEIADRPR